jgi:hypothetical protein
MVEQLQMNELRHNRHNDGKDDFTEVTETTIEVRGINIPQGMCAAMLAHHYLVRTSEANGRTALRTY